MVTRTKFLIAGACFLVAGACSPMLELLGANSQFVLWAVRLCSAAFLSLIVAYFIAYRRERSGGKFQISIRELLGVMALAALLAWAAPGGNRALVAAIIVEGLLIYWRVWMRRNEPFSYPGMAIMVLLLLHFGLCVMMAGFWVARLV
ncbi:MAG TPA: hypothetical protein VGN12_02665 [Pirellulales bacterium]|jgi:hypothetical protein